MDYSVDPSAGDMLFELNPRCQKMQEPSYVNLVVSMYVAATTPRGPNALRSLHS